MKEYLKSILFAQILFYVRMAGTYYKHGKIVNSKIFFDLQKEVLDINRATGLDGLIRMVFGVDFVFFEPARGR